MLDLIGEDKALVNNIWMSDEAHFHLSGFVNKQNFAIGHRLTLEHFTKSLSIPKK